MCTCARMWTLPKKILTARPVHPRGSYRRIPSKINNHRTQGRLSPGILLATLSETPKPAVGTNPRIVLSPHRHIHGSGLGMRLPTTEQSICIICSYPRLTSVLRVRNKSRRAASMASSAVGRTNKRLAPGLHEMVPQSKSRRSGFLPATSSCRRSSGK